MQILFSAHPWLLQLDQIAKDRSPNRDAAHDYLHARRVAKNCLLLSEEPAAKAQIAVAAALTHKLFSFAKDDPRRALSGVACLPQAQQALQDAACPSIYIDEICECIADHPYSLGRTPRAIEGCILQDADRLDAIGAIGIARCFATGQTLGRPFYAPVDPMCESRVPDDSRYTIDHFYRKLLSLHLTLHTEKAKEIARERSKYLLSFLSQFAAEIR